MSGRPCLAVIALAAVLRSAVPTGAQSPPQSSAGATTIHDAAARGDLQAVKAAVAADPTVVDAEKPPNKKTALHYAAQNGHADVVAFLLDKGADVNRPNIAGERPLHYAAGLPDPAVVNLLLARGANPNAKTSNGATPLRMATAFARLGSIQALLDEGADVRDTLPNGQTLLHMAARVGPPESVALLVSRGVDVNGAAKNGQTPLLIACIVGNDTMTAALLDRGADPNTRDAAGWTPVEAAVRVGQPDTLKRLLQAGATPTGAATSDKRTALHHAAARGWLEITRMLLAAGADRGARDSQGRTPLDLAVRYGNRRVADALRGASAAASASSPATPATLGQAPKMGEAVVWYLGHMGWAVRTANHFMVFDYDGRGVPPDEPSLANGSIDPNEIRDLSTTVFITHRHTDHYAPAVFDWKKTVRDITYVAGFKPEGKEGYVFMAPREAKTLGGLDITTTMANDEGVGFFVKVDGVAIFHSGDHNARAGDESFKPEIDFLAGRGLRADLVFMPISVTGDQTMNLGVHYAMKQLSAVAVFPGHVAAREDVSREFARDAAKAGITTPIHCPEYGGDNFTMTGRWRAQLEQAQASEAQRDRTRQIDKALDSIGVRPGMIVAEVGAGPGYLVEKLARRVGPEGKVYAEDIVARMLEMLKLRMADQQLANYETILGSETDPKLPPDSLDMVLIHLTMHFVDAPVELFRNIATSLKPGGRLLLIEPVQGQARPNGSQITESRFRTREAYLEIFAKASLTVERIDTTTVPFDTIFVLAPPGRQRAAAETVRVTTVERR